MSYESTCDVNPVYMRIKLNNALSFLEDDNLTNYLHFRKDL